MAKKFLKEFGIVILLVMAVALLLAIVFYDYIPSSKTVPIKLQDYEVPQEIKDELANSTVDEQNIVRTFYIDNADLDLYESTNEYNKGKANPFADYSKKGSSSSGSSTSNSANTSSARIDTNESSSSSSSTGTSSNSSSSSQGSSSSQQNSSDDGEVYMTTPGKNY